jgi:hypothetical protein
MVLNTNNKNNEKFRIDPIFSQKNIYEPSRAKSYTIHWCIEDASAIIPWQIVIAYDILINQNNKYIFIANRTRSQYMCIVFILILVKINYCCVRLQIHIFFKQNS